ncbi:hypothetical protein GCM10010433_26150 [Streptomyces pulveraceus]
MVGEEGRGGLPRFEGGGGEGDGAGRGGCAVRLPRRHLLRITPARDSRGVIVSDSMKGMEAPTRRS